MSSAQVLDQVKSDLRALSVESRRKHPQVRDASEAALVRLGQLNMSAIPAEQLRRELLQMNNELVRPVLLSCSTKNPKLIQLALQALQRLLGARLVSEESGAMVVQSMWTLMEESVEEVRLLQTAMLLVSNCPGLAGRPLSKALALVLRLHFSRSSMVTQTAAATIRQCLTAVMDRVTAEDAASRAGASDIVNCSEIQPAAEDARNLLTDLCLLVNGEQPHWLHGLTTMTRSLGLELLHAALADFPKVFSENPHFTRLLKEQVCPLIIRLFGPTHKHSSASGAPGGMLPHVPPAPLGDFPPTASAAPTAVLSPTSANFAIHVRLHRLVGVLLHSYFGLVSTECEIFLTLLIRLIDLNQWPWQRMLALEVLHRLVQRPGLVASVCCAYDMKPHASKIFADLVGALAGFVQGVFTAPRESGVGTGTAVSVSAMKETPPAMLGGMQVGPGTSPSQCFVYKSLIVPLHTSPKAVYLDMLDKQEPPQPPEGQALSLAFYSLVEVIRSVQAILEHRYQMPGMCEGLSPPQPAAPATTADTGSVREGDGGSDGREEMHRTLVSSLWCAALAALSLLLETSTDESATESILKSLETMVSLCGRLGLTTPRDAFITAMCKASLPAAYALAVLSSATISQHHKVRDGSTSNPNLISNNSSVSTIAASGTSAPASAAALGASSGSSASPAAAVADLSVSSSSSTSAREFNQVVVVGPALPTPGLAELGKVHLTAKNMQCMRAILSVAHCQGSILGTAWHLLLTTLQHLTWVLGLKPVSGGGLVHAKGSGEGGTVVTTAVVADLAVLSSMLSRLFESSEFLDDVALHHLISALCKLSMEAMQLASANKEPSLFAVAKLQETGLVNLKRMEVLWKPVTHHLLEVAGHSHPGLRNLATDALVSLVNAAVECPDVELSEADGGPASGFVWESERLTRLVLEPLYQLSQLHADTRSKQLACLQHLLNVCGDRLGPHWQRFIQVVGEINGHDSHNEAHIRLAFRCLQQILTDFLSSLSRECYETCIDVTASFAKQQQEMNIALTAVGCIWNITDYFFGKQPTDSGDWMPDQLWICVQVKLKDLCLDPRPAVRKSAGQTLFNTIGSHGRHLQADTWRVVLWKVLFPLLESVSEAALAAAQADARQASEPGGGGGGGGGIILMHHSRDTVGKQWAETQTLALAGVASVFHAQQRLLLGLNDFARAWKLLLECIEQSALSANGEIAQNALNSFQELANLDAAADSQEVLWQMAWQSWIRIAQQGTQPRPGPPPMVPSQDFLTSLCRLLPCLFNRVATIFAQSDFAQLSAGLSQALVCPILSDSRAPYILPTNYFDSGLTPLQEAVIAALETLARAFLLGPESLRSQLPSLFSLLAVYANYAVHTPRPSKLPANADGATGRPEAFVSLSYVAFGERCFELMVDLYKDCASQPVVVRAAVLEGMYKALRQPLYIKYNCPSHTTWRLAYKCLTSLIVCGTPVARQHADHFSGMWDALAQAIEDFLFAPHKYPPGLTVEDFEEHEALDCALVTLVRETFLSRPDGVPAQFVDRMIALLNRGSIHSVPVSAAASDLELHRWLREELAQLCFHTLLSYSFSAEASAGGSGGIGEARGAVSRAAVRTILTRCRDVLCKFVEDQRLSGHCPLPRARLTEVGLSLKALSSLLTAFKAAPQERVDPQAWRILLDTYPAVVEAVLPNCTNFLKPLKELLHLYADLLRVPQP